MQKKKTNLVIIIPTILVIFTTTSFVPVPNESYSLLPEVLASTSSAKELCEENGGQLFSENRHFVTTDWCRRITSDVCSEINGKWRQIPACNERGICNTGIVYSCLIIDQERLEKEVAEFRLYAEIREMIPLMIIGAIIFGGFVSIYFIWKRKQKTNLE